MTHSPGSTAPCAIASASIAWPPRAFSAPATPAPIQKWLLAALTTASTSWAAMSPSAISRVKLGSWNAITRSTIAREHVIRQGEQGVALRAGRERVEVLLGAIGELGRTAVGVIDRRVLAQPAEQLRPLLVGDGARRDHVADDPRGDAVLFRPLPGDEGQGHLAFTQVAAERLADRRRVAGVIEQVVHQLERDPEIEAV